MTTGLVYDPLYLEHDHPTHPENAGRLRAIIELLRECGLWEQVQHVPARDATTDELTAVHDPALVERVRTAADGYAYLDPQRDTYVTPRSYAAALRAAGGVLAATDAVLAGTLDSAVCLVRPPGHHARPSAAMGFCLFNNVAIAAQAASHGLSRIAIVDFDVHHGNGTQEIFWERGDVLYVSTHQYPHYPGSGHWKEAGAGPGAGATVNVSLPAGCGDNQYRAAFDQVVIPALRRFRPEVVLVSAGFDGHFAEPLAQMNLSVHGYGEMVSALKQIAAECAGGRMVLALEGGYDAGALAWSVRRMLEVLLDFPQTPDPYGATTARARFDISELLAAIRELHGLA